MTYIRPRRHEAGRRVNRTGVRLLQSRVSPAARGADSLCRRVKRGEAHMILVTGADGFVGRHIIARLAEQGDAPRALVRNVERARAVLPATGVELAQGDTTKPDTLDGALTGADTVIHCAFVTANRKQ